MNSTILLVEDEDDLASIVEYHLTKAGYTVLRAANGQNALDILESTEVSLVLLDLMLPDMSGVDICRHIRSHTSIQNLPVIMVTAKGEEIDRVIGFEVGADDYVVKPFSSRELVLRIKSLLRRQTGLEGNTTTVIEYAIFKVDRAAHRVWIDGEEVPLTALEFKLLVVLLKRKGLVQTRERLLEDVWEMDPKMNTRTVDKHVQRLRQKIKVGADYIETIRGVGYRFKQDVPS
jgi:two-component system, OmpR family, phosphate regulon response regulator PhoB